MSDSHDKTEEDQLPRWERPVFVTLELSETRAGVFCAAQENFDNAFVDFLFGSDPNCIIG